MQRTAARSPIRTPVYVHRPHTFFPGQWKKVGIKCFPDSHDGTNIHLKCYETLFTSCWAAAGNEHGCWTVFYGSAVDATPPVPPRAAQVFNHLQIVIVTMYAGKPHTYRPWTQAVPCSPTAAQLLHRNSALCVRELLPLCDTASLSFIMNNSL
jgi:hypothetical protein